MSTSARRAAADAPVVNDTTPRSCRAARCSCAAVCVASLLSSASASCLKDEACTVLFRSFGSAVLQKVGGGNSKIASRL